MDKRQKVILSFYAALLGVCVVLMLASDTFGPVVKQQVLPVSTDGFKMVLGALVGYLSAIAGVKR